MTDLKVGDRVVVDVPPSSHFTGAIVGEGRQKLWWNVLKDGKKHSQSFHKSFCRPEPAAAVGGATAMNLDEALAVWAYMQHQYKPSAEAKRASDEAWRVICREACKVIYPDSTLSPSNGETP
jgi:hypothetical protein